MNSDTQKHYIEDIIYIYEKSIVKIVLFCLKELPFELGKHRLISVLKGEINDFNTQYKLNKLLSYSSLPGLKSDYLENIVLYLIEIGLIKVKNIDHHFERPVLILSNKGIDYLLDIDKTKIKLPILTKNEPINGLQIEGNILFEELRKVRLELAKQNHIAASSICSDKTLFEISEVKPLDFFKLLSIDKINRRFLDKYGQQFLEVIKKNVIPNDITESYHS